MATEHIKHLCRLFVLSPHDSYAILNSHTVETGCHSAHTGQGFYIAWYFQVQKPRYTVVQWYYRHNITRMKNKDTQFTVTQTLQNQHQLRSSKSSQVFPEPNRTYSAPPRSAQDIVLPKMAWTDRQSETRAGLSLYCGCFSRMWYSAGGPQSVFTIQKLPLWCRVLLGWLINEH